MKIYPGEPKRYTANISFLVSLVNVNAPLPCSGPQLAIKPGRQSVTNAWAARAPKTPLTSTLPHSSDIV